MIYHSTPDRYSLNTSTVDVKKLSQEQVDAFKTTHHIFVSEQAPWATIADGLPQYDRFRGDGHRVEQ